MTYYTQLYLLFFANLYFRQIHQIDNTFNAGTLKSVKSNFRRLDTFLIEEHGSGGQGGVTTQGNLTGRGEPSQAKACS